MTDTSNLDMLAMMAYLRDAPAIGIHVPGRPDINGASLQRGIRFMFNRVPVYLPPAEPIVDVTPVSARAKRGRPARDPKAVQPGSASAILATVKRVMRATITKHSCPALQCIRVSVRDGGAVISATDLERHISEWTEWPVSDCDFVVNAVAFRDALRTMQADAFVNVEKLADYESKTGSRVNHVSGPIKLGNAQLATEFTADYPAFACGDYPAEFTMSAADLREMFAFVQSAISAEETRYYLNGIYLSTVDAADRSKAKLRAVTTDGHRMMVCERDLPFGAAGMDNVIVPRATVDDVLALLGNNDGEVTVSISSTRFRVAIGKAVVTTKTIDGTFPEYERVIPVGVDATTLDRSSLANAAKAALALNGKDYGKACKLDIGPDGCALSAVSVERGSVSNPVNVTAGGTTLAIGFNAKYLQDIINAMSGNLDIRSSDPGCPIKVYDTADTRHFAVLMPMRI